MYQQNSNPPTPPMNTDGQGYAASNPTASAVSGGGMPGGASNGGNNHHSHHSGGVKSWKVFLVAFVGALVACVLALGVYTLAFNNDNQQLGGSGGTSITVQGDDTTLPEAVAQKCLPSVVNIDVYTQQQPQGLMGLTQGGQGSNSLTESSLGSGIIISSDGYILTNYHVVEGADQLKVTAQGGEYQAKVVGTDPTSDLAVVKIDAQNLTAIEIGSSSDLTVGEWVMAAGSPFGLEQSVSTGIVSATSRSTTQQISQDGTTAAYTNMIQTDAAINPGNSGGALVDSDGKLIGVNTLIASSSGTSSGVGFAIPVDYAMNIAQQIIDGKTPSHAALGVSCTTINSQMAQYYHLPTDHGAYISSVISGSAADKAGLKQGDIITKVGDTNIDSSSDVVLAVRSHNVGDTLSITYNRDGQESSVDVTLGSDS
ncbi:MAG: trypsin-like peptidase domain-containing protein [Eggerthellaceae bacterium]